MTFRLHSRLVLWNLLIIGLISSILAYFLTFSLREHLEKQVEIQLLHESAVSAAYLANAAPAKSLDDQADELGRLLDVRVTLIAPDGNVLGDSEVSASQLSSLENHRSRPEVLQALQEGTGSAIRWSSTLNVEFIYVARRLDPYFLRLAMPLSEVDALIRDLRSQLALAIFIAVGLTVVFGSGNLEQRLPITGDEEIAALGTSLNTMAQNLSAKIHELSDGKQRLELILEAMGQGVMVLDRSGRVSLTNSSILDVLGIDRELTGRTPLEVFRRPELENAVRAVLAGEPGQVLEIIAGTGRVLQANVAPVRSVLGEVDSVVVVFHDLTDIRRTERMRRDFIANVSHEFKTPLTSIRGYARPSTASSITVSPSARSTWKPLSATCLLSHAWRPKCRQPGSRSM